MNRRKTPMTQKRRGEGIHFKTVLDDCRRGREKKPPKPLRERLHRLATFLRKRGGKPPPERRKRKKEGGNSSTEKGKQVL